MNPVAAFVALAGAASAATRKLREWTDQLRPSGPMGVGAGFSALGRAAQLVSAMLGTVLTPALVLVAAGLMSFAETVFAVVNPALKFLTDSFVFLADGFRHFVDDILKPILASVVGNPILGNNRNADFAKQVNAGGVGNFGDLLRSIIQDMRLQIAPVGYSGIAEAGRRLQVQSFQGQIQQKILNYFEQTLRKLDVMANELQKMRPAVGN